MMWFPTTGWDLLRMMGEMFVWKYGRLLLISAVLIIILL